MARGMSVLLLALSLVAGVALAATLGTSPSWVSEGQTALSLGSSVSISDINGDGYADILAEAQGAVNVHYGSTIGPSASPDLILTSPSGTNGFSSEFGYGLSTQGDWNGDGYKDVLIGDSTYGGTGAAWIYPGSPSGLSSVPVWHALGEAASCCGYGLAVAFVGDVNGDGFSDVLVGNPYFNNYQGKVYLYLGSATGASTEPAWTYTGDQALAGLGVPIAGAGDVNGDGHADVIVGERGWVNPKRKDGGGKAMVFLGSTAGLAGQPAWAVTGTGDSQYGHAVSSAGDVNGDGFSDILVGDSYADVVKGKSNTIVGVNRGRVFLYLGSVAGPSTTASWSVTGDQDSAQLGDVVIGAGDIDGDGFSDVIITAPHRSETVVDQGRIYAYRGSAAGLSSLPFWIVDGPAQDYAGNLGVTVASGDENGDGHSGVLLGFPHYFTTYYAGRVELYLTQ